MNATTVCRLANRRFLFQSLSSIHPQTTRIAARQNIVPRFQQLRNASRYSRTPGQIQHGRTSQNPLDNLMLDPAAVSQRAKDIRYMKFCALGLLMTIAATGATVVLWPAPESKPKTRDDGTVVPSPSLFSKAQADSAQTDAEFQGKPVVLVAGGQKIIAKDDIAGNVELVETGTSTIPHFPKTIKLPSGPLDGPIEENEYTLVGLGIRTVSFLSIQVYVVGMYAQTNSLAALQAKMVKHINPIGSALIAGEKDELRSALLDGEKSYELWDKILREHDLGLKTAFRIVPTRNTDFGHLRDGWVRGITSRTQEAQRKGNTEYSDDSFGVSMKAFKDLMAGKGKAPTGSVVLLTRDSDGTLGILFEEKDGKIENFGKISDERIARLVWLGYLGGKNVSSEPARKGITNGVMELVERPIGSVETMVV